jgi:hypothetical protein
MRIRSIVLSAMTGFFCIALAQPATAQEADPDRWGLTVAPYFVFPNMSGQTGIGDVTVDVDANPGDIFDKLQFGFMIFMEMSNQDWAVGVDALYMDLGQDGQTPILGRESKADMKQLAIQWNILRRVATWAEVGIGVRLNSLDAGLFVAAGDVILPEINIGQKETWLDPLIAARFTIPMESKWHIGFQGDIGGFGIGSDFAWQAFPFVGYRFSQVFELAGGYRAIGMKYENGDSGTTDYFLYDMTIFGPQLGIILRF